MERADRDSDEDMARIVFSDVKQVHLAQLVEYLYTGTVQLGMQDRSEMATIISCLLIHRTFSPKEDSQIKQECEYDDEPEEDNYNESLDSDDELNLNKFESKLEEYDVKPTRISQNRYVYHSKHYVFMDFMQII